MNDKMKKSIQIQMLVGFLLFFSSFNLFPQITRQPYLQIVTPESIIIRWDTNNPEVGTVYYGLSDSSLTESQSDTVAKIKHEITIKGLSPNTKYYYSINETSEKDPDQYFITSYKTGNSVNARIWVISDWGQTDDDQNERRAQSVAVWKTFNNDEYHADFIISCGDQSENDTEDELSSNFFGGLQDVLKNTPLYTISGNHDDYDNRVVYKSVFSLPTNGEAGGVPSGTEDYYSFNYGNMHFVALSCEGVDIDGAQKTWLQNDLTNNTSDWLIAFHHRPMHSAGYHPTDGSSTSLSQKENWLTLLENAGVDLILSGHNHVYERSYMLDNLTGNSADITEANKINTGLGRPDEEGPYYKPLGCQPHKGTIFVGSAGGGVSNSTSHYPAPYEFIPVHFAGSEFEGSLVIDVSKSNRMDVKFLCTASNPFLPNKNIWDYFSIVKSDSITSVSEIVSQMPDNFYIKNYPNPFNPQTQLLYKLPATGYVKIIIYDVLGRQVSILKDELQKKGSYIIKWNAKDDKGIDLSSGIYIAQMQYGRNIKSAKMMLLR